MNPPSSSRKRLFLACLIIIGTAGSLRLMAQDSGNAPPPDAQTPSGPVQTAGGGGNDSINFPSAPVDNILDVYEQLSGKHLIRDPNLRTLPPIGINASGLDKAGQLKLIEATLLLDGVVIVPVDDRTAKVIAGANKGQNPRSEGLRIYANAADLPVNDEVVSYYMQLRYLNPVEAERVFRTNSPPHPYGTYVTVPSVQAIILTESTSVIRQLIALKELIDVPPAHVVTEFIQLNRADAEKVADILHKLLDQKSTGTGDNGTPAGDNSAPDDSNPVGDSATPSPGEANEPLFNEHSLISGSAKIIPDTRSNELIIVTRPVNLPFLRKLIAQLDQPDNFMVPQRRPLKYVLAQDILPAIEASLAQGKDEEEAIKNEGGAAGSQSKAPTASTPSPNGVNTAGTGSASSITPELSAPTENNVPTVITIGNTKILADNRSNSIIVFGSPDMTARVFEMIDQLDRKPLQVYLATVIGELTVTQGMQFGIDLLQKYQKVGQGGLSSSLVTPGTTTSGSTAVPEPNSLTSALGFPLPTGLTLYGAIGSTLDAYVRALESTDRFKIISRPSVYTTNNKLAVIASGSQVPVPSNITSGFTGSTSDNGLTTTASVQYENVLLQLDIIPLINANHEVTLKIRQTNNTLGSNNVISGNDVPTINTQEINTEVTVPDKSTVVIGGLISDNTTRTTSGVPFLSDIPLLGYLFSNTSKNKERDELIIMIQPTVVETDADQIAVDETEKQRTILGREAEEAAIGTPPAPPPSPSSPTVVQTKVSEVEIRSTAPATTYNSKTGTSTKQTTTTTTTVVTPATDSHGTPVPVLAPISAAPNASPDVSNGKMPANTPLPPSAKTP